VWSVKIKTLEAQRVECVKIKTLEAQRVECVKIKTLEAQRVECVKIKTLEAQRVECGQQSCFLCSSKRTLKPFVNFVVNIFGVRANSKFQFVGAAVSKIYFTTK